MPFGILKYTVETKLTERQKWNPSKGAKGDRDDFKCPKPPTMHESARVTEKLKMLERNF